MTKAISKAISKQSKPTALSINGLYFSYPQGKEIFHNLSLQVASGERIGLIGPNGAGKTSLFLLICGLLHSEVGKMLLFGQPIAAGQFRPEIGFVFQNPDDQLFCPTVRDDVAFGPQNMGLSDQEVDRRVNSALETTGMIKLADRIPHQLSGGEKCMVAIAAVLAMQPQLILYDEPSANLDLQARRRLINFLKHSQSTFLLSSHDLELIVEVCDRVLLLNQGKIIADGHPVDIMGNEELMKLNSLEKPYSLK